MLKYLFTFLFLNMACHADSKVFYYPDYQLPIFGNCDKNLENVTIIIEGHLYTVEKMDHKPTHCPQCNGDIY